MSAVGCRLSYGVRTNGQEIFVSEVRALCAIIRNFMTMIGALIFELITLAVDVFMAQDRYTLHLIEMFILQYKFDDFWRFIMRICEGGLHTI